MLVILINLLFIILVMGGLAFWIMMIVDCAKRDFANQNEKIIWLVVVCVCQLIGALVYWFVVVKKSTK